MTNLETLRSKHSKNILFECVTGSTLYGTNNANSDVDMAGVFALPYQRFMSMSRSQDDDIVSDKKHDTNYYSLNRFISLVKDCNPNMIELLWVPDSKTIKTSDIFEKLKANRHLFISKQAYFRFSGYAFSQIKKATGQNKMVHNEMPEERPRREQFCKFLPKNSCVFLDYDNVDFPDLDKMAVTKAYGKDSYLLFATPDARGVFCENENIKYVSISQEDANKYYVGALHFANEAFEQEVKKWEKYWTWRKERNETRWANKDGEKFDYDHKNMSHCVRLNESCKNILINGEPLVELTGDVLKFVRNVREGKFSFDYLMSWQNEQEVILKELYDNCTFLPEHPNMEYIDKLYISLMEESFRI